MIGMEASASRTSMITSLLVGLVLLIVLAGLFVSLVPVVKCPDPNGVLAKGTHLEWISGRSTSELELCQECQGKGRVSLAHRLLWHPRREPLPE